MFSRFVFLPIGLFLIWCVISQRWYVCHIKNACNGDADKTQEIAQVVRSPAPTTPAVAPPPKPQATATPDVRPLVFQWNDQAAITRASFDALKHQTIGGVGEGKILEIQGLYYPGETAPPGFPNMGLARASAIKKLLIPPLEDSQVVETSRLVSRGGGEDGLFEGVVFMVRDLPQQDAVEIVEVDDQISIHFPLASVQRESDPRVDEYLSVLAERLQGSSEVVRITGHTDSAGARAFNFDLGLKRAKHIGDILIKKGVDSGQVQIFSQGELNPVASNESDEGRRQNRRVDIKLVDD